MLWFTLWTMLIGCFSPALEVAAQSVVIEAPGFDVVDASVVYGCGCATDHRGFLGRAFVTPKMGPEHLGSSKTAQVKVTPTVSGFELSAGDIEHENEFDKLGHKTHDLGCHAVLNVQYEHERLPGMRFFTTSDWPPADGAHRVSLAGTWAEATLSAPDGWTSGKQSLTRTISGELRQSGDGFVLDAQGKEWTMAPPFHGFDEVIGQVRVEGVVVDETVFAKAVRSVHGDGVSFTDWFNETTIETTDQGLGCRAPGWTETIAVLNPDETEPATNVKLHQRRLRRTVDGVTTEGIWVLKDKPPMPNIDGLN